MARQYTNLPEKKTINRNAFSLLRWLHMLVLNIETNLPTSQPMRQPSEPLTQFNSTRISIPSEQTRASTLNSLHLRITVHRPSEPNRQLVAVPELALFRLHAAQLPRRAAANSAQRLGD
jgi:hypothetical protein